jgi:hypothetical protein
MEPGRGLTVGRTSPGSPIRSRSVLSAVTFVADDLKDGTGEELPRPSSADLLVRALPFDRVSLDRAIDQFFQQLEELNAGDLVKPGPARIVLYSLAMASTFAALDSVRKWWRQGGAYQAARVRDSLATTDHIGFPELPGSWSSRLS